MTSDCKSVPWVGALACLVPLQPLAMSAESHVITIEGLVVGSSSFRRHKPQPARKPVVHALENTSHHHPFKVLDKG